VRSSDVKLSEGVAIRLRGELAVKLCKEADTEAGPIRVDTKPDVVEAEGGLGNTSTSEGVAKTKLAPPTVKAIEGGVRESNCGNGNETE